MRAGCLEAVLGLAIYSKAHADVWDCAAALLREHPGELSAHRQQSLLENLLAAASQMAAADRLVGVECKKERESVCVCLWVGGLGGCCFAGGPGLGEWEVGGSHACACVETGGGGGV